MYDTNEYNSYRYAQLQSSILNKTNLSTSSLTSPSSRGINLKNKFSTIQVDMNNIESDLRKLMADTNESMRVTKHMTSDVAGKELNENKNKLLEEIKKLEKSVKYGIAESQQRSQKIWEECKNRLKASENLKNAMNNLRERIARLENTLGFHNVSENVL